MKKDLFRTVSLVICVVMLCSTILGTAAFAADDRAAAVEAEVPLAVSRVKDAAALSVGENEYGYSWFTSFEDLKEVASKSYSEFTYYYYNEYDSELVITESITIPANLDIYMEKFEIPEDVTVTVEGSLGAYEMDIQGTLDNRGYTFVYGKSEVSGKLINRDSVLILGDVGGSLHFAGGEYAEKRPSNLWVSGSTKEQTVGKVTGLNEYDFAYEYNDYTYVDEKGVAYKIWEYTLYDYFNSDVKPESGASVPMFRMYDPNSSEHFYSGSTKERRILQDAGWNYEGVGFNFPASGEPVYRLYHQPTGEHLYTMDVAEKDELMAEGWNLEGVAFNSAPDTEVAQYRLYNPNATRGAYHFTGSEEERDELLSCGWEDQGIGWYSCWK